MKKTLLSLLGTLVFCCLFSQTKKTVSPDGSGDFTTVQAAIDAVADGNNSEVIVYIKKGIYKECITIGDTKSFIRFIGESPENTKITFDNFSSKKDSAGKEYGTTGSSSVFVNGNHISFENISFENSSGPVGQAVAVNVLGQWVAFKNCRFLGYQDTLYTKGATVQYYKDCYIEGTVDFIFGAATALFDNCTIHSKSPRGYVTAASTPEDTAFGYVFLNCNLTGDGAPESVFLGRPWRPFAKTVFINCKMGQHIKTAGWNNWGKTTNEQTVYYAEYNSTGKGAAKNERVGWSHQLTKEEANTYNVAKILKNWQPFK